MLRRSKIHALEGLTGRIRPENFAGAWCLTCLAPSDEEIIVDEHRGNHNYCKVLVRCHGAEELATFDFLSSEWDHRQLARCMQTKAWFDPLSELSNGIERQSHADG